MVRRAAGPPLTAERGGTAFIEPFDEAVDGQRMRPFR
jgi:hypothetical protein